MSSVDALVQGLYDCGGYEEGHAYLKAHATEITADFVSALCAVSMDFQTKQSEPELAAIFGELGIVAALLLGRDAETGMALYSKGSVLSRQGHYREAIALMDEALPYLRNAEDLRQLANCVYDMALCYEKLEDVATALRLLREALSYEQSEKDRADTLAFMLMLEARRGGDVNELAEEMLQPSRVHKIDVRHADDIKTKQRICERLAGQWPERDDRELFISSIPTFLSEASFHFFVADDTSAESNQWPPYAYGLLRRYRDTFNDRELLGLEAARFADADTATHLTVMQRLSELAREFGVHALCIPQRAFANATIFEALARRFDVDEVPSIPMQGAQPGLYSAFTDAPDTPLFFAHCLPIRTEPENWDFSGQIAAAETPLYRGEGRLLYHSARANWGFGHLKSDPVRAFRMLASHFFLHGFQTRAAGTFAGDLQAQLLHQGYVDQPTCSLSRSKEVCIYYATDKHQREEGGLVFRIDTATLRRNIGVYDSQATLRHALPLIAGRFHEVIVKVMRALDGNLGNVLASGAFLERCFLESRRRVEAFGGGRTFGPAIAWNDFLSPLELEKRAAGEFSDADLEVINDEFEMFWNVALGKMETMVTIDAGTGIAKTANLSRAYFVAFDQVRPKLKAAWRLNQFSANNHPGWDLSPFGYVTKTIRDQEFFSGGDVPGECILDATVVDRAGCEVDVFVNSRATGTYGGS